jgi:hypothetical protein
MNEISECGLCGESYSDEWDITDDHDDDRVIVPVKKKEGPFVVCPDPDCGATLGDSFCQWLMKYARGNPSQFLCVSKNCDCCDNPYACGERIGITDELLESTTIEAMDDDEFWAIMDLGPKNVCQFGSGMDYYNNPSKTSALIKEFIIKYVKLEYSGEGYGFDFVHYEGELICEKCIWWRKYE